MEPAHPLVHDALKLGVLIGVYKGGSSTGHGNRLESEASEPCPSLSLSAALWWRTAELRDRHSTQFEEKKKKRTKRKRKEVYIIYILYTR